MNNLEIDKVLKRNDVTRPFYNGCFPADQIPSPHSTRTPHCMVVNMDSAAEAGSHWVAIFVQSTREVDYFDSFADWPPDSAHLRAYLSQFERIRRNLRCIQSDRSAACGKHVLYFLYRRCQGWPMHRVISHLIRCRTHPDRLVSAFCRRVLFAAAADNADVGADD